MLDQQKMLSSILIALLFATWGFITGVVTIKLLKPRNAPKDIVDSIVEDFRAKPKGDFIKVNEVENYLKEHTGEIRLGDIIEDDE